jgi:hypothetical protein
MNILTPAFGEVYVWAVFCERSECYRFNVANPGWFLGGFMLKHMKAHKHLKPGENGTLGLVERFGNTLLCVRYRYDAIRDIRIKTAEIIVDEKPGKGVPRIRETDTVLVQVPYTMKALRDRLKGVGAKWDPAQKLWRVRWGLIRGDRELMERVVKE